MICLEHLLDFVKTHVPFHQRRAPDHHRDLSQWPLMSQMDLAEYSLDRCDDLLSQPPFKGGGQVISSGGTTGKPKYIYYSHSEMATLVKNISHHFLANGISAGDKVVNYFTAGDMWSGFLVADRALSLLPVTIFPLGYTPNMERALEILKLFKPNVIVGIPSMLLDLAQYSADQNHKLSIQKVFYGGEAMTSTAIDVLTSVWGCELIRSASYAATDVGAIGWQCPHCETGVHYAFDDMLVEIINKEIVVTSLNRLSMPIIRYRTGDGGEWFTPSCNCGNGSPTFRLLSRTDNIIIIWGCWLLHQEVEETLRCLAVDYTAVQILAFTKDSDSHLLVKYESAPSDHRVTDSQFAEKLYQNCQDARENIGIEKFLSRISLQAVAVGTLYRNERTGKVTPIIDSRPPY